MPRYRRHFMPGRAVFLTLVTEARRPWIRDVETKRFVLDAMARARRFHPFRNLGYVLLDDHMHWLLAPALATNVSHLVGSFKRDVTLNMRDPAMRGRASPWQGRFYDHVIRGEDDLERHLDYIHFNPVKHGYVRVASAYPWSSFRHWRERGAYPADWGTAEPATISRMHRE